MLKKHVASFFDVLQHSQLNLSQMDQAVTI
jgi:hypothetical protein